jgi:hypothetical protein
MGAVEAGPSPSREKANEGGKVWHDCCNFSDKMVQRSHHIPRLNTAANGGFDPLGAILGLARTVMIQRVGLLGDLTSMTDRTNPVTSDPLIFKVVFWPRCWS